MVHFSRLIGGPSLGAATVESVFSCPGIGLIGLAFGFKFLVARDVPGNFLRFIDGFICGTFNVFLIHKAPLPY
jgi:ABC-type dipeptide/oligopeptide/nickel transport system permease component